MHLLLQPRLYILDLPQELLKPLQVLQLLLPRLAPVLRYDHPLLGWRLHEPLDLVHLVVIVLNELGVAVLKCFAPKSSSQITTCTTTTTTTPTTYLDKV